MAKGKYDEGRLLTDPTRADARSYAVRTVTDEITLFYFRTGTVNGKSPDEVAIRNLFDASEHYEQELAVWRLYDHQRLATAQGGIGQDHRAVAAKETRWTAHEQARYRGKTWERVLEENEYFDGEPEITASAKRAWKRVNREIVPVVYPGDDEDRRGVGR